MADGSSAVAKTKVAILGGGPAGLSAAFWLTATPALQDKFEVTVYTPGWRLGGKCASGRDGVRILEHGLHILMGCYRYVFATIGACYREWRPRPDGAFQKWSDAFTPQYQVSLPERANGVWTQVWNFNLPSNNSQPVPQADGPVEVPVLGDLMSVLSTRVEDCVLRLSPAMAGDVKATMSEFRQAAEGRAHDPEREADRLTRRLDEIEQHLRPPNDATSAAETGLFGNGWSCPGDCLWTLANLGLAVMRGYLRDVFLRGDAGIAALNELDFRAWLASHGAHADSLASAPIRALYDLTFAFPGGDGSDINKGSIAAGVSFRFMLEACFGYAAAPLWKMNAGTGDTLFTPMYQVLKARKVNFRFFHQVQEIALGHDGRIGTIAIAQQAALIGADYAPLQDVAKLDCWPAVPLWGQLVDGGVLSGEPVDFESPTCHKVASRLLLTASQDFDAVVLATPPEIIAQVAAGLDGHDTRWDGMRRNSTSVATGAFQLWLKADLATLGWQRGSTVLTSYQTPYESWGDMTHLLAREPSATTKSIAYFCGCLPQGPVPVCTQAMNTWLQKNIAFLWPAAVEGPGGGLDPRLVDHTYCRFNVDGSERYVLTPPKSVQYRLSPQQAIFGNLYVAGDWTLTRFSGGCVESAFESGVLAARAIQDAHA